MGFYEPEQTDHDPFDSGSDDAESDCGSDDAESDCSSEEEAEYMTNSDADMTDRLYYPPIL